MTVTASNHIGYTKEEVDMIKKNLDEIGTYCRNHFVPKLPGSYVRVSIEDQNDKSMFLVSGDGVIMFRPKSTNLTFERDDKDSVFFRWQDAIRLLKNWPEIKNVIEHEIEVMENEKREILNFNV